MCSQRCGEAIRAQVMSISGPEACLPQSAAATHSEKRQTEVNRNMKQGQVINQ